MFTSLLLSLLALQGPVSPEVEALLARVPQLSPAAILRTVDAFEIPQDENWAAALPPRLADSPPKLILALGRLLALADRPEAGAALVTLLAPGGGEDSEAALATLRLPAFLEDEPTLTALSAWLTGPGAEASSALRAEAAWSLFEIGDGAQRRGAKRLLRDLLHDPDSEVRANAALALGQCGEVDDGEVLGVLESLGEQLGPRAALAASLVAQHEEKERYRRKLETLDRLLAQDQDQLSGKNGRGPDSLAVLDEVMRDIQRRHMEGEHYSREELIAAAANGMLGRLDPHSDFMTGKEFGDFVFDMHPEYGGIGAYVNMVDGVFTITRPIYSGPAYHAGLLSGDKILEVDGWSTLDQPMDETIKRLKGEPATPVEILVVRRGWTEPRHFNIHRARIQPPTLFSESLPGGLLYIDLVRFTSDCGEVMRHTIEDAEQKSDLKGVVLDLRGNPGGYLSEAVQVCDVFLPKGKLVVSTRSRTEGEERYLTREPAAVPPELPLAILVNRFSASASEIVSGALSVHGRAVTVGERTFGKGSVQNLLRLRSAPDEPFRDENRNGKPDPWEDFKDLNGNGKCDFGPRVKLTIAYYYLPDDSTIHTLRDHDGKMVKKGGVTPDVPVEVPELDIQSLRELDRLLNAGTFREYAEKIAKEDPDLAKTLAVFDGGDASRYPAWEEWYQGLNTTLPENEARRWVRRRLRAVVSDLRGKVFAGSGFFGDYEVDVQLQEAIRQLLNKDGLTVAGIPEYQQVF